LFYPAKVVLSFHALRVYRDTNNYWHERSI